MGVWAVPTAAGLLIEYKWWKEIGQVSTWITMLWYSVAPEIVGTAWRLGALWTAHSRGLHFAGVRERDYPLYSWLVPAGLAVVAFLTASASIDGQTVMLFIGSRGRGSGTGGGADPFWPAARFLLVPAAILFASPRLRICAGDFVRLVFWATARGWQLMESFRFQREHIKRQVSGAARFRAADAVACRAPGVLVFCAWSG